MEERAEDIDERVLAAAVRLFTALGYDGTTLSMISDAVGQESAGSRLLKGGKAELYRAVFNHFNEMETKVFEAASETLSDGIDGIHRLADIFLDFTLAHPEIKDFWGHRTLKDAMDLSFPEQAPPPLEIAMAGRRWRGLRADVDVTFLAWTILWIVIGYTRDGLNDPDPPQPNRPGTLEHFREELHIMIDRRIRPLDG